MAISNPKFPFSWTNHVAFYTHLRVGIVCLFCFDFCFIYFVCHEQTKTPKMGPKISSDFTVRLGLFVYVTILAHLLAFGH